MPAHPRKIEVPTNVGAAIRALRESRKESQTAFARELGTLPSAVSKWESGKNRPNPDVFVRLAGISAGELRHTFLIEAGVLSADGKLDLGLGNLADTLAAQSKAGLAALSARASQIKSGHYRKINASEMPGTGHLGWDPDFMKSLIEAVDLELKKRKKRLPIDKYAELIVIFYEHFYETRKWDSSFAEPLLRIA